MSRKAMKSSLALTIMGLLLLGYTNCSQPKVTDAGTNPYSSGSDQSSSSGMSLSPSGVTISWDEKVKVEATGGVAPYYYRLASGSGYIDYYSGIYFAPSADTEAVIEVSDTAGTVSQTRIYVNLQSSNALRLTYSPSTVTVNTVVTLSASGGSGQYTYFMVSGVGTIAGNKFNATSFGAATIGVRDSAGAQSTFTINVSSQVSIVTKVIYRLYHSGGKQYLYSATQTEGTSAGFALEGAAFKLITTQQVSSVALSRCYIASSGGRYLSTGGCGAYVNEGTLGYIYTYAATGSVPLYNCFKSSTGSYLSTTDYNSCINNGFNVQGSAIGYVPQ